MARARTRARGVYIIVTYATHGNQKEFVFNTYRNPKWSNVTPVEMHNNKKKLTLFENTMTTWSITFFSVQEISSMTNADECRGLISDSCFNF